MNGSGLDNKRCPAHLRIESYHCSPILTGVTLDLDLDRAVVRLTNSHSQSSPWYSYALVTQSVDLPPTLAILPPFFEIDIIFLVYIRSLWLENDHELTSYRVGMFLVVGQCWLPTNFVLTEFSLSNFAMTPWEAKRTLVNIKLAQGRWEVCPTSTNHTMTFVLCELLQPHNDLWWHGNDLPQTW